MKHTLSKKCKTCGVTFKKLSTQSVTSFLNNRIFCSRACHAKWQLGKKLPDSTVAKMKGRIASNKKPLVEFNCTLCKVFVSRLAGVTSKKTKNYFCSTKCANGYRNEGKTSLQKTIRESKPYKEWRTSIFTRDDFRCVLCKTGGRIQADHIKPFALYPELRFNLDNGRTLCIECHKKTDTWGGRVLSIKKTLWANAI